MNARNKMKEIRDKFERKPREIWISSKNIFAIDLSDIIHRFKSQILVVYARCYFIHCAIHLSNIGTISHLKSFGLGVKDFSFDQALTREYVPSIM